MDFLGNQVLASSRVTQKEHSRIGRCHQFYLLQHVPQRGAVADEVAWDVALPVLFAEPRGPGWRLSVLWLPASDACQAGDCRGRMAGKLPQRFELLARQRPACAYGKDAEQLGPEDQRMSYEAGHSAAPIPIGPLALAVLTCSLRAGPGRLKRFPVRGDPLHLVRLGGYQGRPIRT